MLFAQKTPLPENNEAVFTICLVITSRPETQNTKYSIISQKMKLGRNHSPFLTIVHNLTSWIQVGWGKKKEREK